MGKRKRKRLFPKHLAASTVKVSRIDPNKIAAYASQRSKATVGPRDNVEHKLDNSFMQDIPITQRLHTRVLISTDERTVDLKTGKKKHQPVWAKLSPRAHSLDRRDDLQWVADKGLIALYRLWRGDKIQGVSQFFVRILKEKEDGYKLMLFFSGDDYLFIQEVPCEDIRRVSKTYHDVSTAEARRKSWDIAWIHIEKLKVDSSP